MAANAAGYASGEERKFVKSPDGSTTISFEQGDFRMHDNYFGGEPFGGREVIFYKEKPVWIMVYYGGIVSEAENISQIYRFLQHSLSLMPFDQPFRGPALYTEKNFKYTNKVNFRGIKKFIGIEKIYIDDKEVYATSYSGGLVDQREE